MQYSDTPLAAMATKEQVNAAFEMIERQRMHA